MGSETQFTPLPGRGEQAQHISREMVKLMRKTAGRGPTMARTTIGRDHVLVLFQETLTEGERVLVDNGHRPEVLALRQRYQDVLKPEACRLIEETLKRPVIGFMSTNHFDPDLAAELFVLETNDRTQSGPPEEAEHRPESQAADAT